MARALVIVESVAKATRIQGMLGPDYIVKPSIGHIRDLPQSAADIPASVKSEKWARLGINVNDHFKPVYVVSSDRKKIVSELKAALKEVDELYLATDEDREGEAIAWHLQEVLNPKVPVKRMVFHEITPAAIERAVNDTRDLDLRLVDAQEGRRFLDRLVGYQVSPLLWDKVPLRGPRAVGRHPLGVRTRTRAHGLHLGDVVRRHRHPRRRVHVRSHGGHLERSRVGDGQELRRVGSPGVFGPGRGPR